MLHHFFANVRKGSSHTELVFRVNSVDISLTPDIVNMILKTKIKDGFKGKIINFSLIKSLRQLIIIFTLKS